jgi:HPt (histidine-containing phosphotransfer) domain-containing protein
MSADAMAGVVDFAVMVPGEGDASGEVIDGAAPAVDWSVLRELGEAMDDPELADDVAAVYRAELPRRRDALARAAADLCDDPTALADAAHTLKAASLSVGAKRLGALCARTERLARGGDIPAARDSAVQTLAEIARVERAVAQGSNR